MLGNKKEFSRGKMRKKTKKRKISLYATQNREKQKLRLLYGLKEKQLKNIFLDLQKKKGDIHQHLLTRLESRLDNLVFRSGLVNTRRFARQWVGHGHFLVNGKKINKPNCLIKPGSTISLREKMRNNELIKQQIQQNIKTPTYLEVDKEKLNIVYSRYPSLEETEKEINVASIVEWYNKRI